MPDKSKRILVINPGSTSTKLSLFEDRTCLMDTDVFHDSSVLLGFRTINDQLPYRMQVLWDFLAKNQVDLHGIDAIVGRGGSCQPVESGVYRINDQLIADTRNAVGGLYHSSMLGVQMAAEVQKRYGGEMFMVDPPVVDELCDLARITGVKGVYRKAVSHALNLHETARRHAAHLGRRYEDYNFIVCHIDGGISITAHAHGRVIDGNDAGGGEGPFTPTRMGSMAVTDVIRLLEQGMDADQLRRLSSQAGGLSSWFGTSSADRVHEMAAQGDPVAVRIWNAMIYQTVKWIGAMSTVLKGEVDGILLTGGLLRFGEIEDTIRKDCGWIAPVTAYPGEFEQEAMAFRALDVLEGRIQAKTYTGRPAWEGFRDSMH